MAKIQVRQLLAVGGRAVGEVYEIDEKQIAGQIASGYAERVKQSRSKKDSGGDGSE